MGGIDLEHLVFNEMFLPNPSPQGSGIYTEEETERLWETKVVNDSKHTESSRYKANTHMKSQT